jgi:hypothetical protein
MKLLDSTLLFNGLDFWAHTTGSALRNPGSELNLAKYGAGYAKEKS